MFSCQANSLLLIFTIITVAAAPEASGSVSCQTKSLQYPFGFSPKSPIRFNCSDSGAAKIGEFLVQSVTATGIYVRIPPECNRAIGKIAQLFRENYAPSWDNIVLLQKCKTQWNSCVIRRSFVERRLNLSRCGSPSCFSPVGRARADVMSYGEIINRSQCGFWFSAMTPRSDVGEPDASLEFERLRLGWWLKGGCSNNTCSQNANCTDVKLTAGGLGHRCSCLDGFRGDGFAGGGGGCRRASKCHGLCGVNKVVVLVAGVIFGALLMVVLTVTCYFLQKHSVSSRSLSIAKRLLCEAAGNSGVLFYTYKEIERATDGFSETNKLGTGAYGTVYAGKLRNDSLVAIKRLRHKDTRSIDQVVNEIKLLSSVSHPNLVRLLGCCVAGGEPILVYEFMPNGTLSQHLQQERGNRPLPWTLRLTIATQTANAIAHLHSSVNPPIYHRDIKSSNILLDYDFNSKISDFGLSRLGMTEFDSSHISTAPQGTPGYVDPQYHQDFQLSDKSDVYSFGVVLVEIISALKVIDFARPYSEVNLAALAVDRIGQGCVEEIIDPCLEPKSDQRTFASIHNVAELAFRCLSFHRDMRPTMIEVAEELERIGVCFWVSSFDIGTERSKKGSDENLKRLSSHETSPVSVQEPWPSQRSSPQENSLSG